MLNKIICHESKCLRDALKIINDNGKGVCFIVNKDNILVGILTDGDIRRALLNDAQIESSVKKYMNRNYISLPFDSDIQIVLENLSNEKIKIIPLCNGKGQVVDYADQKNFHTIPVLSPCLEGNEMKYLADCVRSNWISSQGKYVREFEDIFKKLHNNYYALAVSSGTTALHLALEALGIKNGDEVIVPNITFAATINSVLYCNATPVLCEIDYESWCIDIDSIKKLITTKTKAIIPVHLYGQPCDLDKLVKIANENKIYIVEDCAEAIGSKISKKRVGTFGDCSTFSFYGNKTITTGEGGMVLFRDKKVYENAKLLRDHGMSSKRKYWHDRVGFNYRMTNLQAAVGVAQMERFSEIIKLKQAIFNYYSKKLKDQKGILKLPSSYENISNSSWLYTLILDYSINRDDLVRKLQESGIESRPTFCALSEMPPYIKYKHSTDLKNSKLLSSQGLSLPSSTMLKEIQLEHIVNILSRQLNTYCLK